MKTECIVITDLNDRKTTADLERAGEVIRNGGLVVFPTETVYGLGGDATDKEAAARIYAAKGRPADNPLIVHITEPQEAEKFAYTSPLFYRLAETFMPGPLTVILPVKNTIPSTVTAGLSTVAIRVPSHPIARAFLKACRVPVAAPSANLSGSPSPTCARHVLDDMDGRVDVVIDGGDCDIGVESTIVKIDGENTATLLRPGGITPEMLRKVIPHLIIAEAVLGKLPEGAKVLSPGMKYKHYAPKSPLVLLDGSLDSVKDYLSKQKERIGVLWYGEDIEKLKSDIAGVDFFDIGSRENPLTETHKLFYLLRETDKGHYDRLYAPLPSTAGLEMALYNRMIRASSHQILHLEKENENG